MQTLFEAVGGEAVLLRLAAAWHARVLADEVVSHAFSHGYHPDHTRRLAAYWAVALGGPDATGVSGETAEAYLDETAVVRLHAGNGAHEEMDRRAVACFDQALEDAGIVDPALRRSLHGYFAWATEGMARYPRSPEDVPAGLTIPRWSWDGPLEDKPD
jgi:hemoglobin